MKANQRHTCLGLFSIVFMGVLLCATPVYARETVVIATSTNPDTVLNKYLNVGAAHELNDPTQISLAVHDRLNMPGEIRLYSFTATTSALMPIEVFVPTRHDSVSFAPAVAVIDWVGGEGSQTSLPFKLPYNYAAIVGETTLNSRAAVRVPWTLERLYHGERILITTDVGKRYYIVVYEPHQQVGEYVLMLGTKESSSAISLGSYVKNVFPLTLGLVGGREIPWRDTTGLLVMFVGLSLGFGTMLSIGALCLLTKKTAHWTEVMVRVYSITEPLHLVGLCLWIVGGVAFFYPFGFGGVSAVLTAFVGILGADAFFAAAYIRPAFMRHEVRAKKRMRPRLLWSIGISASVAFLSWFLSAGLLAWYLLL